ncbi:hypothetical protein [Leyella stercorea]|uniref:hypothetical protein n=1 Tax=Leyella stercorea TaxID=363265 RepID=UPI00242D88AF|nr:hypothetical protein [Leyella stercorea]
MLVSTDADARNDRRGSSNHNSLSGKTFVETEKSLYLQEYEPRYIVQNGLEIPYGHNADWGKANEWASRVLLEEE